MATFNAGAIEARLTLDRSDFTRELREARAQADAFERDPINIRVDLGSISEELARLQAEIARLERESITIIVDFEPRWGEVMSAMATLENRRIRIPVEFDADQAAVRALLAQLAGESIRIPVNLDLDQGVLQAQLQGLDRLSVDIDVDINGGDEVAAFLAVLKGLDRFSIDIDVDIKDTGEFLSTLALIQLLQEQDIDITIVAHVRGLARVLRLEAALIRLNTFGDITINVDVDTGAAVGQVTALRAAMGAVDGGGGGGGFLGGGLLMIALKILLALAPIVAAAVAGLTAVIAGLGAALVGAGGGLAILAGGFIGIIGRYKEFGDGATEAAGPLGEFARALEGVKTAWDGFLDGIQDEAFKTMADALNLVAAAMPALTPLFLLFNEVLQDALVNISEFINSPEMGRMIEFFGTTGVAALDSFLAIGGNLILFFGRLFEAFGPFAEQMLAGLEEITAGWAEWADGIGQTQGFQDFIDYVVETGPMLLDMLGSILDAFINIGEGLAPLAPPMMAVVTAIADFIAAIPPDILGAIAVAIGVVAVSMTAMSVAASLLGVAMAIIGAPIAAIIIGVLALAAGLVYLYNQNETFRNAVQAAWGAIRSAWNAVVDVWRAGSEDILRRLDALQSGTTRVLNAIGDYFRDAWRGLVANTRAAWNDLMQIVDDVQANWRRNTQAIADFFTQTIPNTWRTIQSATASAWQAIQREVGNAWQAVQRLVQTGVTTATNFVRGLPAAFVNALANLNPGLTGIARVAWAAFGEQVQSGIARAVAFVQGLPGRIQGALPNMGGILVSAGAAVISGFISGITGAFGRVRSTLGALTRMLPDWKGPPSRDALILRDAGNLVMGGFVTGLEDQFGAVKRTLNDVTDMLGLAVGPDDFAQRRLGIGSTVPSVTPQVSVQAAAPDLSALIADNRAMREAMDRMVDAYTDMVNNQIKLHRQGAIR